jgi:hypothetical protein
MELNIGRNTTRRIYAAAVDAVAAAQGIDPLAPQGWPQATRQMIEAAILQNVLANAPSTRYATRMMRVLTSVFLSDTPGSFQTI